MIKEEDIKVLQFKDELIELLQKYRYNISGDNLDNGDINIESHDGERYILNDEKTIIKEEFNESGYFEYKSPMEEIILNSFKNKEQSEFCFANFAGYYIGIITNDRCKAESTMNNIIKEIDKEDISLYINNESNIKLILKDGKKYIWIKPLDNARGYRFKNAYIDKGIGLKVFYDVILPICVGYCGKDTVKVI